MSINLDRYKVVYNDKVFKALSLQNFLYPEDTKWENTYKKPEIIEILIINEDGNIETLRDEAWRFQFIPILNN